MSRAESWQKKADRWIGIPVVAIFGFCLRIIHYFQKRRMPLQPQSAAIFCVAAIGDLLILSAPLQKWREKFPNCRITLFCGPDNRSVVPLIDPDGTLFTDVQVLSVKETFSNLVKIRKTRFDFAIDSGQWARWSALMTGLTRANWRIGFQTKDQHRHFLFDHSVSHSDQVHELTNFLHLFELNSAQASLNPQVNPNLKPVQFKNFIICHLFPSGARPFQKEWPKESWLEVFRELRHLNYTVVLTGSPADRERLNQIFTDSDLEGIVNLVGQTRLEETASLLAQASLVISVNTGVMHLAASVGAPLIALHGPTDPKRWGPVSKASHVIQSGLACSPCLNLGFDYGCPRNDCMREIRPDQVLTKAMEVLQSQRE